VQKGGDPTFVTVWRRFRPPHAQGILVRHLEVRIGVGLDWNWHVTLSRFAEKTPQPMMRANLDLCTIRAAVSFRRTFAEKENN